MRNGRSGFVKRIFIAIAVWASSPVRADTYSTDLMATHFIQPDVTYLVVDGEELKLDIYAPQRNFLGEKSPTATLIFFHGGGWVGGSKASTALRLLPYLAKGWAVVSVDYRLAEKALAPAAVADARCAIWWVIRHAGDYGFDPDRIVLSGRSAGGHLALIAGMLSANSGYDRQCPELTGAADSLAEPRAPRELKVAAIVNWAGVTDVDDLIEGPNDRPFALQWLGPADADYRHQLARRISPISHVRNGLPPILTIHGSDDNVVPYAQAVSLHDALARTDVPNRLFTIGGGDHFLNFTSDDYRKAFKVIDEFLEENVPHSR